MRRPILSASGLAVVLALGAATLPLPAQTANSAAALKPAIESQQAILQAAGNGAVVYYAQSSWLGVSLADLTAAGAKQLGLASPNGALVKAVLPDSPAAKAGIEPDDVIVALRGRQVIGVRQLQRLVEDTPAHRTVPIKIIREGHAKTLEVTLGAARSNWGQGHGNFFFATPPMPPMPPMPPVHVQMPPMPRMPPMPKMPPMPDWRLYFQFAPQPIARLGLSVTTIPEQLAHYFGASTSRAVLIRQVAPHSLAAQAGLRAGDVIVAVGGTPVTSRDELSGALVGRSSHAISVIILRDRHKRTLRVPAPPTTVQPVGLNAQWAAWAQAERQWAQELAQQLRAHPEQWRQLERDAEQEQAEGQRLAQQIQQRLGPEMQRDAEQEQAEGRQMAEQLRRQLGPVMQQLQKELQELQKQYGNRQYTGAA